MATKLAAIHNEFNVIHPFREGNGRTIRLFIDLLTIKLGLRRIDWNVPAYMEACRDGLFHGDDAMANLILRSLQS